MAAIRRRHFQVHFFNENVQISIKISAIWSNGICYNLSQIEIQRRFS